MLTFTLVAAYGFGLNIWEIPPHDLTMALKVRLFADNLNITNRALIDLLYRRIIIHLYSGLCQNLYPRVLPEDISI